MVARKALLAAFPGVKIVSHTEKAGCGGGFEVQIPDGGALKKVFECPQENLAEWSGQQDDTLAAMIKAIPAPK